MLMLKCSVNSTEVFDEALVAKKVLIAVRNHTLVPEGVVSVASISWGS